eukprot:1267706-Pleurochrysis_carterae.AAC.1
MSRCTSSMRIKIGDVPISITTTEQTSLMSHMIHRVHARTVETNANDDSLPGMKVNPRNGCLRIPEACILARAAITVSYHTRSGPR